MRKQINKEIRSVRRQKESEEGEVPHAAPYLNKRNITEGNVEECVVDISDEAEGHVIKAVTYHAAGGERENEAKRKR